MACRGLSNIGCLVSNSVITKRTIRPLERMIPAGPINGEYVAILLLFSIGLLAVSVFNSTGKDSIRAN